MMERVAAAIHAVHGTRGLFIGALGLLVLGTADPFLPRAADRVWLTLPVFVLFIIGAATLPREGVAVQQRARSLGHLDGGVDRITKNLWWPLALLILLAPRSFLAAYGIPHLNPLTGVIFPVVQQVITTAFLFIILLVAIMYVRSTRAYARHIVAKRPKDLSRIDRAHQERDALLWMGSALLLLFGWLLHGFWTPFSLFAWPPHFGSLATGARGVASFCFALAIPLLLFIAVAGHMSLLRDLIRDRSRLPVLMAAAVHVILAVVALFLHAYDLLWIVQYRGGSPF